MKKSNKIISIIVGVVAILLIIEVYFLSPQPKPKTESPNTPSNRGNVGELHRVSEPNTPRRPGEPNTLSRSNTSTGLPRPGEPNAPDRSNAPRRPGEPNAPGRNIASPGLRRPGEPNQTKPEETGDPNDPMVAVQINNMDMKNIMTKLMDWTGKNIIPANEAMSAKITAFAPKTLPRSKALQLIYSALKMQGYIVEQYDKDTITIKRITDAAKLSRVPIIDSNTPLAAIQNKEEIVQKFFKLNNYTPSQIGQIIIPMLGEYGNLSADDDARILGVIDTVRTLMRVESVIQQFDTTATEPMVEDLRNGKCQRSSVF